MFGRLLHLLRPLQIIIAPIREALINLQGLSPSLRLLAFFGYLTLFFLLVLTLFFELFDQYFPTATFTLADEDWQISYPVMLVSSLGFAVGWAFIASGATDCRRRVFLPIMGLFTVQLCTIASQGDLILLSCGLSAVVIIGLIATHFVTPGRAFWRDFPLLEYGLILVVLIILVTMFWLFNESDDMAALSLSGPLAFWPC